MFDSARKRIIATFMTLVTLILALVVSGIFALTSTYSRDKLNQQIDSCADMFSSSFVKNNQVRYLLKNGIDVNPESYVSDAFLLVLNDAGETVSLVGTITNPYTEVTSSAAETVTASMVSSIVADTATYGKLSNPSLRYSKTTIQGGTLVVLMSTSIIDHDVNIVTILLIVVFFGALLIAYFLIWFLIKSITRPLEEGMNQQTQFIADISHELKTPITVILANMDIALLNEECTIADQKKWLQSTKEEADRMFTLVQDMLNLTRSMNANKESYQFEKIDITDLVDDCIMNSEAIAYERKVDLQCELKESLYAVVDPEKIKQLIMILLDNALKYAGEDGWAKVNLKGDTSDIVFTVVNSGDPIPPEKAHALFDRFFRVDDSRTIGDDKNMKSGYGLGLAIAKNIVQNHNGVLTLDYSDETGTCFSFSLPGMVNSKSPKVTEPDLERPLG